MDLLVPPGTILGGRYALEREIGRGGMARVYLARDLRQNRLVAVKILRPDIAASLGPQRFLREIDIASRLAHPHILPVHDSGDADGLLFYVMPYVEGESLRERISRTGRPPLDEALTIIREVADALAYAHRLNVVHRDIKPGNILLQAGHAVVADFGVARAISVATDERVTSTGLIVGTPMYMSPEQAAGETIDGRTDVYALGCVAYEMLTGAPPYTGATPRDVIMRSRTTPHRPIRSLRPDVPQLVAEAIEKALAKQPEDRYPNALALAEALRAPGGWTAPAEATRNGRAAALAGIVLAIAAAFLGRALLRSGGPEAGAPLEIVVLPIEGDTLPAAAGAARANALFAELIDWIPGLRAADPDDLLPAGRAVRDVPLPDLLARARRAGGRYVVAGTLLPGTPARLSVDLYATETGERLSHAVDSASGSALDGPVGRIAAAIVGTVAQKEGLKLGSAGAVLAATNVLPAVGHMLQAQGKFWTGDLEAAAAELQGAVEADSNCGLAYQRLSVTHAWQHDFPAALEAADAGLRRADRMAPRWVQLLRAQRYLVLGYGDSAIATYQSAVLDNREDIDAWFGLGESLVHYGAFSGVSPADARPALERVSALDSNFAPIYEHLVDLAVYADDSLAALKALARMPQDLPYRRSKLAEIRLRFGTPAERAAALKEFASADRELISQDVIAWAHGAFDLRLADTAAGFLLGADRVPDDRLRGVQYRLAIKAALGTWAEGYGDWSSLAGSAPIDPWLVNAALAGYPAGARAEQMYDWARVQMRAGRTPDFTLPPWDDLRQGFEALVYRAVVAGDSAETGELLRRVDRAPPAGPAEPAQDALRWSLRARLALLARDTAGAVDGLRRAVARIPEPFTANYPFTAVAPQRVLLARLLLARGDTLGALRWQRSFVRSWSVADLLYLAALDSLPAGGSLSRPRSAP